VQLVPDDTVLLGAARTRRDDLGAYGWIPGGRVAVPPRVFPGSPGTAWSNDVGPPSVRVGALVTLGASQHGAQPGHMYPGISEHQSLDVVLGSQFVAVLKSSALGAYFRGEFVHTDRQLGIRTAQTTVHVRLAGRHADRPQNTRQGKSANKTEKHRAHIPFRKTWW
jgi:hypothetical protein